MKKWAPRDTVSKYSFVVFHLYTGFFSKARLKWVDKRVFALVRDTALVAGSASSSGPFLRGGPNIAYQITTTSDNMEA